MNYYIKLYVPCSCYQLLCQVRRSVIYYWCSSIAAIPSIFPGMSCCCWISKLLQAARRGKDHIEQLKSISLTPLRTRRQKGDISLDYVRLPEHRQGPIHAYVLYILRVLCRCTDKRAHISSYLVGMAFYLPASGLLGLKSKEAVK